MTKKTKTPHTEPDPMPEMLGKLTHPPEPPKRYTFKVLDAGYSEQEGTWVLVARRLEDDTVWTIPTSEEMAALLADVNPT
jgi:hypothetical protein